MTAMVGFICLCFASAAMANSGLVPRTDGNDVLVPNMVIEAIPNYNPGEPVYAACDLNGWLQSPGEIPDQIMNATKMQKTEDGWVAQDMKGVVFHPTQVQGGQPVPAKLEEVYIHIKEFDFIDWSGKGPSLKVE